MSGSAEAETSGWATGGNLINQIQNLAGAGTQNAALAFGGRDNILQQLHALKNIMVPLGQQEEL